MIVKSIQICFLVFLLIVRLYKSINNKEDNHKLRKRIIKEYHQILKRGTTDERKDWFKVGEYKKLANEEAG